MTYKVPGGGLSSTAPDVARFGTALVSGRLLSADSLTQMLTRQKTRSGRVTGFGLGLALGSRGGRREAWHTGGQERVSTVIYLQPDSGLAVAILTNLEKVQPQRPRPGPPRGRPRHGPRRPALIRRCHS